ncbi:MAG: hypothetical protein L3J06_01970 [Cyclobacteriaceae bacterium]|nr:hypothetical protein [Cyclobacteriaceae bacterium]
MKYKNHIILLTLLFSLATTFSFAQSFLVLEKMGTKKRFVYHAGQQISYQLKGHKSMNQRLVTGISDSAFVANNDTILFSTVKMVHIGNKRESGLLTTAGPILISAGVIILAIDVINRGLIQDGDYTWDSGIGTTSAALVSSGALIILLRKNKKNLSSNGWWRLRKAAIY